MEYILYSDSDTSDISKPTTPQELLAALESLLNKYDSKTIHILRDMEEATSSVLIYLNSIKQLTSYPKTCYLVQVEIVKQQLNNTENYG